jgi:competence protein ComEA
VRRFFIACALGAGALTALCGSVRAQPSVDVNVGSLADIERIKGVGTALAESLLLERDKAAFKDWADVIRRVKGVGPGNAARLSAAGLRVNGAAFSARTAPSADADPAEAQPGR